MTQRAVPPPPRHRPASRPRLRTRLVRGDQRGAAIVEFALVIPIFFFVIGGLITFGVILAKKQQITNAAADGARAAVGAPDPVAAAKARVEGALGAPSGSPPNYTETYVTAACPAPATGQCITVTVTWDYKNHPLVPSINVPGLHLGAPDSFHSTAVVQVS